MAFFSGQVEKKNQVILVAGVGGWVLGASRQHFNALFFLRVGIYLLQVSSLHVTGRGM